MRRYDRPRRLNRRTESAVPCPSAPTTNRRRTSTINTKPVETQSNEIEQDRTDSNASRSPNAVFFAATSQEKSSRKPEIRLECSAHSARTDRTMPTKTEQPERPITSKTLEISLPERSKTPSPEHPNKHARRNPRAPERTRSDLKKPEKPETTGRSIKRRQHLTHDPVVHGLLVIPDQPQRDRRRPSVDVLLDVGDALVGRAHCDPEIEHRVAVCRRVVGLEVAPRLVERGLAVAVDVDVVVDAGLEVGWQFAILLFGVAMDIGEVFLDGGGGWNVVIQPSPSRAVRRNPRRRLAVSSGLGLEVTQIGTGRCTERGSIVTLSKSLYSP